MIRIDINKRLKIAELKSNIIENKQNKMDLSERLIYIRTSQYKKDMNIINRTRNLYARSQGYAKGFNQMVNDMKESGELK